MAPSKIITLKYDPDHLRRMFESVGGDTKAFGARLAGLMMGGGSSLDAIPLAMFGVVHVGTEDVPGVDDRDSPLRVAA